MRRRYVLGVLIGVLISLIGISAWGVFMRVPNPGIAQVDRPAEIKVTSADVSGDPASVYALNESEAIRHIRSPDVAVRRELLRRLHLDTTRDIVSITLLWDGDVHLKNLQIGVSPLPRTLFDVLIYSLEIPTYMLDGIGIAHDIALPGDWIIRRGADPAECLSYVGEVVRESGHPSFAFVREKRDQTTYTVRGAPRSTAEIIQVFAPFPGLEEALPRGGTVDDFLRTLSRAIGQPIRNELSYHDPIRLTWRDNSFAYYQLGTGPTEQMVSTLLEKTGSDLHVTFDRSEYQSVVWRLDHRLP